MMDEPDIIIADETNFDFQVLVYSQKIPVLVDFWATWCVACQTISPLLESLVMQNQGRFRLAKVDVDNNKALTQRYQVHTIPTLKAFENGLVTQQIEGITTNTQVIDFVKLIIPGPENLLIEKAISLLSSGSYPEVEEVCLQVLEDAPAHPKATLLLVKSLIWQGDFVEALSILTKFPSSPEFQRAEKLKPLCETLIAGSNEDPSTREGNDAIFFRAIELIRMGNMPAALDGLLDVLRQDKTYRRKLPKKIILGLFELMGDDHPTTIEYRPLLANILF
jgi:putative thioredoxin